MNPEVDLLKVGIHFIQGRAWLNELESLFEKSVIKPLLFGSDNRLRKCSSEND